MSFGWKNKAERLRMVILSAAHQIAKELPPGFSKTLEIFARVAKTGDGRALQEEMDQTRRDHADEPRPLWEPIEVHGWEIQATMYLRDGQLWWLVHAVRKDEREPSDKDIALLNKVLDHLGAEPTRHMIVGPSSSPPGEPALLFGWWTWRNRWPLFELQVNKTKKRDSEKIRIVPLGSRETDGYTSLSTGEPADESNGKDPR